ncbi:hypothetical protein [Nodosilinea sp. P-1105]|uniref:hypothetical protein n=1 Tax=Nodosilinea sp. P-1105 TaxID=2546229 RepID=UPI00146CCFBF|nr:hypothetical protein [Nodosilinea sp. P-1105]NMF82683.1 hypothetical protein [Nodosilinea sp. P-1105]
MSQQCHQFSRQWLRAIAVGFFATLFVLTGLFSYSSSALASSKGASLTETMDLEISEAAQEFVSSVLDEYSDALEDSFSEVLKPLKSVTKDLNKQIGKAAAAPTSISQTTLAPKVAAAQEVLTLSAESLDALVAETADFKATLGSIPEQLTAAIDAELGPKFDELQQTFADISDTIAALSEDTAALDATDPSGSATAFSEHATQLATKIEAAKAAIEAAFDS